ncbi:predicted protein [Uncinocarpus reesii 1704]|uniref:Uncharacterized protein n=1 Tax=Uncinocarpus reesii (strain UAMH 1704) TaxID=336963 RepID=C4JKL9_UNCRE|nr:uncharacterized protein UREG_00333 [Uncinocarpus reesii 1704]EEP75487.1 predicted protein [Uncinocarpus reesii 1704]
MTKTDVGQMKSELSQMRAEMLQLSTHVDRLGPNDPSNNLNRLQSDVNQLHLDVHQLYTTILATRTDLGEIQAAVGHIKTKMSHTERVRFNSLAHTVHAPITPVPVVENDGSVRWPEYFPRTIWKFWCLKRRNRIHRLVELAEFYQLEGYQYWGRMPQTHDPVFPEDGYLSDSSDSTDLPSDFTLAEATRLFPEACHQALAATLGLVYYKIRNEVGEGPNQRLIPARQKRGHDELVSLNSANPKPSKLSRRSNDLSPTNLHKIITGGPAIDANSIVSEGLDKLGWNANGSQASDEAMNKLKGMVTDEVNSILIKALERGRVKLQPSHMEIGSGSPIGSSKSGVRRQLNGAEDLAGSGDEDMHTVATEIISPISHNEDR